MENFLILFDEVQNLVEVQYQGVNAAKLAEHEVRITTLEGEVDALQTGTSGSIGDLEDDINSLTTLVQAQSSALTAEIGAREVGDINLNESFSTELIAQQQEYSELIEAEAEARAQGLLDEATARGAAIDESSAIIMTDVAILATTVEGLATQMGAAQASIIEVNDALVTETAARAAQYSAIQADFGDTNASVLEETVVRADADTALAYSISVIEADVDGAYAAITSEASTRASADSALASDITTLSATVGSNTAAISSETSARVAADGTINARYSIKVDVNGHVSGFGLISDANNAAPFSQFIITADAFRIFDGTSDVPVFEVTGGIVYADNLMVRNANIETLVVDKIISGTLGAEVQMGDGKLIFDNGSVMWVMGLGFGADNEFIEWFGPHFADFDDCTRANAISYKTIDGDAYFGGSLSAGVLAASVTGTNLADDAEVSMTFGTNGDPKNIVFSYIYSGGWITSGSGSTSGAISATIQLYRKIGTGSETLVATLNPVGTYEKETESGTSTYTEAMSASTTYTDSDPSTDDRTYRAVITARSLFFEYPNGTHSQKVTIISTEEP